MSEAIFNLPDAGEGLTEAEIVSWRVKEGDVVILNQILVEIETAKSLVELPSPYSGAVQKLLVAEGDTVPVGAPIIRFAVEGETPQASDPMSASESEIAAEIRNDIEDTAGSVSEDTGASGSVLVGYGTGEQSKSRRQRAVGPISADTSRPSSVPAAQAAQIIAKPPIRKLARDLGVDLAVVHPTGLAGEITREDVVRSASQVSLFRNIETPEWPDEREERIPVKGVRKMIAQAMVKSAFEAPHVSVFVDVDATRTMEFVRRLKNSTDFAGVKVSPLLIMAKAILWAVQRNPSVNSTWTDSEIIMHNYVNLGIAAATPRGLLVPNIKEAQSMSLLQLAHALENLTMTARDGKTSAEDQQHGTITITNIGVFGMDFGTPILNPGEVAIIALGTIKQKPWVVDGQIMPRYITTVGGSFDHRVVDGDVVSRFVADVASVLEEPALLLD
ncbi:MAG: dihydrolipoamide acetyltransferase family protein [Microbacteriaceae bacterium]